MKLSHRSTTEGEPGAIEEKQAAAGGGPDPQPLCMAPGLWPIPVRALLAEQPLSRTTTDQLALPELSEPALQWKH